MHKSITKSFIAGLILYSIVISFGFYGGANELNKTDESNTTSTIIFGTPKFSNPLSTLIESFEGSTFPPSGWIKINAAPGATGFERHYAGETPVPGFNYGYITTPQGGGQWVAFCNYLTSGTNSGDQWLCTPQIYNVSPNDSLYFWLRKFGNYNDHFQIRISTTNQTPPSAYNIYIDSMTFHTNDSGWVYHRYRIGNRVPPASNIYIGFREWIPNALLDGASFSIDLVQVTAPVGIRNIDFEIPVSYKLEQNYPNPFNPVTKISYDLPKSGNVKIVIYDILGHEIETIVNSFKQAGSYTINFDASNLSSGIYFYKLTSGSFSDVKKMSLVK